MKCTGNQFCECRKCEFVKFISPYSHLTERVCFADAPATAEFLHDGTWHVKADPGLLNDDDDPKWNALVLDSKRVWVEPDSEVLISEAMKEVI